MIFPQNWPKIWLETPTFVIQFVSHPLRVALNQSQNICTSANNRYGGIEGSRGRGRCRKLKVCLWGVINTSHVDWDRDESKNWICFMTLCRHKSLLSLCKHHRMCDIFGLPPFTCSTIWNIYQIWQNIPDIVQFKNIFL